MNELLEVFAECFGLLFMVILVLALFFQCHCGNSLYKNIRRPDGRTYWMCVGCGITPDV